MNVKGFLELLVQHEVILTDMPRSLQLHGEVENDRIYIDIKQTIIERVGTLVHEVLHAYYDSRQIEINESQVESETTKIMRILYGPDYCGEYKE